MNERNVENEKQNAENDGNSVCAAASDSMPAGLCGSDR